MNKIFTGENIKKLDLLTIRYDAIASEDLIEVAARAFCNEFRLFFPVQRPVIVCAGPGNNGADGLAIARRLSEDGYSVQVYLFSITDLSPECAQKRDELLQEGSAHLTEITDNFNVKHLPGADSVLIDALFGTGLNRPLEGGIALVVQKFINASKATVVSVDVPSGLFTESNLANDRLSIVRAHHTYTFEFPKFAFLLKENNPFVGKLRILPIHLSGQAKKELPSDFFYLDGEDISQYLKPRNKFSHKGHYGHALLMAGSRGMMGAAVLAAKAALRSGVGKLTCHIPSCGEITMQTSVPEALVHLDAHNLVLSEPMPQTSLKTFSAIGIGPGLGTDSSTASVLASILLDPPCPLVLDADALNLIAQNSELLDLIPPNTILTPHPGEFSRLLQTDFDTDYQRLSAAREFAQKRQVVLVLKGAYTAVCTPGGKVFFNTTGNPGMATAGSGDVLTGMITAFSAQGLTATEAAVIACFLHGRAGDLFAARHGMPTLVASDLIKTLPEVFTGFAD